MSKCNISLSKRNIHLNKAKRGFNILTALSLLTRPIAVTQVPKLKATLQIMEEHTCVTYIRYTRFVSPTLSN